MKNLPKWAKVLIPVLLSALGGGGVYFKYSENEDQKEEKKIEDKLIEGFVDGLVDKHLKK